MKALIIVDMQNDFCPGGALPVKDGNKIVPLINDLMKKFGLVVATQDWHPKEHGSFASNHGKKPGEKIILNGLEQILWPDHCVQGTKGAEFVKGLDVKRIAKVFQKGMDKGVDSYSGFFDNGHKNATGLGDYLKKQKVAEVHIVGLATDYCVKFTALDALALGFKTVLVVDACKGVNLVPGDVSKALQDMRMEGVQIMKRFSKKEIAQMYDSLASRLCERKALKCLFRFLPAYFSINGFTDGWEDSLRCLKGLRALCKNDLKVDELNDIGDIIEHLEKGLAKNDGPLRNLELKAEE